MKVSKLLDFDPFEFKSLEDLELNLGGSRILYGQDSYKASCLSREKIREEKKAFAQSQNDAIFSAMTRQGNTRLRKRHHFIGKKYQKKEKTARYKYQTDGKIVKKEPKSSRMAHGERLTRREKMEARLNIAKTIGRLQTIDNKTEGFKLSPEEEFMLDMEMFCYDYYDDLSSEPSQEIYLYDYWTARDEKSREEVVEHQQLRGEVDDGYDPLDDYSNQEPEEYDATSWSHDPLG